MLGRDRDRGADSGGCSDSYKGPTAVSDPPGVFVSGDGGAVLDYIDCHKTSQPQVKNRSFTKSVTMIRVIILCKVKF